MGVANEVDFKEMAAEPVIEKELIREYRKKPVTILALKFTGNNVDDVRSFAGDKVVLGKSLLIRTLEGDMEVSAGDYIIRGVKGEFYPCKQDIFEQTYEEVTYNCENKKED